MTVAENFPALHCGVVEAGDAAETEHTLGRFVVIEIIFSDEDKRRIFLKPVEHEYGETVDCCSDIVLKTAVSSGLLCHSAQTVLSVNLRILHRVVPQTGYTGIVSSRTFGEVCLQAPAIHRLRSFRERVQSVGDDIPVGIIKHSIVLFAGIKSEVLLGIGHRGSTLGTHGGVFHSERP